MNINGHRCCKLAILALSKAPTDVDTAFSRVFTLDSQDKTCYNEAYGEAYYTHVLR